MSTARGGYTGHFLRVNLDTDSTSVEETPDPTKWLGPRGWNAYYGWTEVGPGVGPFGPENRFVISAGPLVGTTAPTAGRCAVSSLAPRGYPEPMWATSTIGGYIGAELKFAGFDGIVVQGQADSPRYLLIEDSKVSLRDASDLWGKSAFETQQILKDRHSRQHQIACIGPAGENRVRFACILHRLSNASGNGGFGGVLGAKNLKAIVVRGTGGVDIADPDAFNEAVSYVWNLARGGLSYTGYPDAGFPVVACTHGCSVRCYMRVRTLEEDYFGAGSRRYMGKCVGGCWAGGVAEFRLQSANGDEVYIPPSDGRFEHGQSLGQLAESMGMTAWAYWTWGRYLRALRALGIDEIGGEKLDLENENWWRDWIMKTAHREGLGNDFADDVPRFYDKYQPGPRHVADFFADGGSRGHGWHREGRTMERHPSPYWEHSALLYASSTRDVSPSTHGFFFLNALYGYPDHPLSPEEIPARLKELSVKLYGSEKAVFPGMECIETATAFHQHRAMIKDSLGVCDYVFPMVRRTFDAKEDFEREMAAEHGDISGDLAAEAKLFAPCTGLDISIKEMESPIAERIVNVERCIEVRNNGRDRDGDELVIPHYQWHDKTDGTHLSLDASEFRDLLDRYYDLRGWNRVTGWPTPNKLRELDLDDLADTISELDAAR